MQEPPQDPMATGPEEPEVPETPSGPPARVRGRKRRFAKRWSRRFSIITISIFVALVVTFFTVDIGDISIFGKSIRTLAEAQASKYLERPMHIGRIVAYPGKGQFAFEDVEIEGYTKEARPFFKAKRILVNLPWWTMFRKELNLEIDIYDWKMAVEKWPDGAHLPRLIKKKKPGEPESKFPFKIKQLDVFCRNGEFIYDDHVAPWRVTGPNLEFALTRANNLNTYVGNAKFTHGLVKIQNFEPMSTDFSTRFQINGGRVELKHIDLLTDGAETHLDGYVDFGNWPDQEYHIQSTVDFNRMRELFFAKADWRMSGQGRFNGIFKIAKDSKFDLSGLFKSDEAAFGSGRTEWRFNNLDGELQWTPTRFIVKRADSDFLNGRLKLGYALDSLGAGKGSAASLSGDYSNVDLYLFTRQFGWTALEPQGRMRGQLSVEWINGQFDQTMQGRGTSIITAPAGQPIATAELPVDAAPIKKEVPFQKNRPFGEFAIGGNTSFRFSASTLDFDDSWIATPTTYVRFSGHARGGEVNVPFHVTSHDWQNSDRLFSAIMTNFGKPTGAIEVGGRGKFDGKFTKTFSAPRIEGHFEGDRMRAFESVWGRAAGDVVIENSYLNLSNGRITYGETGTIATSGRFALGYPRADGGDEINATIRAQSIPIETLRNAFKLGDWPVDAHLALADLTLNGKYEAPSGSGSIRLENGVAWDEPFDFATSDLRFDGDGSVSMTRVVIGKGEGRVLGDARISWADDTFLVAASTDGLPLQELSTFRLEKIPLSGQLKFTARGYGSFEVPTWEIQDLQVPDLYAADEGVGALRARFTLANRVMTFNEVAIRSDRLQVGCQGTIRLVDDYDSGLHCHFEETSLDPYFKFVGTDLPFNRAIATGTISANGPLRDYRRLDVAVKVTDASLTLFDYQLINDQSIDLSFRNNVFRIDRMRFQGQGTHLQLDGQADASARSLKFSAIGQANLAVLQAFYPSLEASGVARVSANLAGTFDSPALTGEAEFDDGRIRAGVLPSLDDINGRIVMANGRISIDKANPVKAVFGEGPIEFWGDILLDGYSPSRFDLHAFGNSLHVEYPDGLQTTLKADLQLVGPVTQPVLQGDIDVLRASYSIRLDPTRGYFGFFGTGNGEQAVEGGAVSADVRPASPLRLNVRIRAPRMPFVDNPANNTYIEGIATVNVAGTIDQPVITGRVEIPYGRVTFNGNRYNLTGGAIDFSDPTQFEPFFDVTAESDIRAPGQTYHVTIRLSGRGLRSLDPQLSAEPWLSEMQIVSLIMGESVDPNTAQQRALSASQEEQARALGQMGAAFILSPISSTVGNAIQRVTTLSTQIVPMLGTESTLQQLNPTARIVLGRQVSSRVYVTYSRTLSGSQSEIILVEIEQNDRISWVLSRNEDKTFAVDFRVRYVVR